MTPHEFDIELRSGRVHAQRWGSADAPLTLCVHGLSANMHAFDFLAERLAAPDRQIVAIDLRGRGRSAITPPGTYGLAAHAEDVLEVATRMGAERFDAVGWSLGGLIGITAAAQAGHRLRTLTLIDHAGYESQAAQDGVRAGLGRLDAVVERPEIFVDAVRAAGAVTPWSEYWERLYRYEMVPVGAGFAPSTSKHACLEDLDAPERAGIRASWPKITMPALLVRATVPLAGGDVVTEADRDALQATAADLRVVEIDRNHFGVMTDERTATAIAERLAR
jgi:pimeloyl-ACP methyl ester carboxylesterase